VPATPRKVLAKMFKAQVVRLNVAPNKRLFMLLSAVIAAGFVLVDHDIADYYLA
jgi:hypothetical protein